MTTYQVVSLLSELSQEELHNALFVLLLRGKLDFVSLSEAYVRSLERRRDLQQSQLVEAETCVLLSLRRRSGPAAASSRECTQRGLYLLNKLGHFNVDSLNAELGYDEDYARSVSRYPESEG